MTTVDISSPSPAGQRRSRRATAAQVVALSRRSVLALVRQPALVVPSLAFPLVFAALGTSSFARATDIPGFPRVDSYLDFALAGAIAQGVLFGSVTGATALATDIENGFFDRLLASPSTRVGIIVGRLAGAMAYGAAQTAFFAVVLLPFGLSIKGGIPGTLVLIAAGAILALAVGALMSAMALRTGSSEAVQGAFPLLFIILFFSSAFFPRETMDGVYARIADINPMSHLIEGMRDLVIDGFTASAVARALLVPTALACATVALAMRSLDKRVRSR